MRAATTIAVLLIALTCAAAQAANYYKWVDAHGTVHFSDLPPPDQTAAKTVNVDETAPTLPPPGVGYQLPTQQQKAAAAANQAAVQKTNAEAVDRNCATARGNVGNLEKRGFVATNESADLHALTPAQREQALADARAQAAHYCAKS